MHFEEHKFDFSSWREDMAETSRATHGSWTIWVSTNNNNNNNTHAQSQSLAKLRGLEPSSPATTLSIGMESSGSLELARSSPLNIPAKRKRPAPQPDPEDHHLALALGSSPPPKLGDSVGSGTGSLTSAESDMHVGLRRFSVGSQDELRLGLSNNNNNVEEDVFLGLGHPVVDEGSSSARWRMGGGVMPTLLQTPTSNLQQHHEVEVEDAPDDESEDSDLEPDPKTGGFTSKTCRFSGCDKGARGASGLCIAHGGGRRCQKTGCSKGAEGKTAYCKAHGGGRRCQSLGCTKSAEGKTEFCIAHGGGRRCSFEGCGKAARGRSGLCIRHGGGKRCQFEGCCKSAEGFSGLCISHGGGRRCQALGCTKGAQGSTMFCKAHGGGKRCMIEGCGKGAEGSTPLCKAHGGGKRCRFEGGGICPKSVHGGTQFCVAHGGGKRCAVPECSKSARGRTAYCVRHGGGKRCRTEGCSKSAQGSTDYCKAHGGGKRCCWGQPGSRFGQQESPGKMLQSCERFARGKLGLCAAHSSAVNEEKNGGAGGAGLLPPELFRGLVSQTSTVTNGNNNGFQVGSCSSSVEKVSPGVFQAGFELQVKGLFNPGVGEGRVPEGRVHNGGLLALLRGSSSSSN